jgi:quinol monooxygenase YgiN
MGLRHSAVFGAALALMAAGTSGWAQAPATTAAPTQPVPSQTAPSGPAYAVTYFEVAPAASRKTGAVLRQFAAAARKEDGSVEFLALHEIARPGRYALVEAWRDKAALDAHGAAMKALADKLQASFTSPFDARQFWTLSVAPPAAGAEMPGAIYVLTHVDVFPSGKDQVAAMVKELAEASRKDSGALRFDALVWDGHPNHFHLVEAWANRGVREAHALADHTRQFRAKLVPFEGALYDERLYEALR